MSIQNPLAFKLWFQEQLSFRELLFLFHAEKSVHVPTHVRRFHYFYEGGKEVVFDNFLINLNVKRKGYRIQNSGYPNLVSFSPGIAGGSSKNQKSRRSLDF